MLSLSIKGLIGAFLIAIGGTILFNLLYEFAGYVKGFGFSSQPYLLVNSFIGFLLLGLGLWLIAESGKTKVLK